MIKKYKKSFAAFFSLLFLLAAAPLVSSALVAQKGDNIVIVEDVDGNFFGAGNLIVIKGTVNGDVFVVGNSISISGVVNGDVFAAGSSIDVTGTINGNLRAAGSSINIRGKVNQNILSAGANLIVDENAFVGGHITYAGASLILNGPVSGQIDGVMQSAVIDSSVGGDVNLFMNDKKSHLVLSDNALLSGNLKYKSPTEAEISDGAQILGETSFTPLDLSKVNKTKAFSSFKKFILVVKTVSFLSLFILGLLLIYLAPKITDRLHDTMKKKPWANLGMGFVAIIITPILAILLFFTIIGIPLAMIMLALYAVMICFSKVVAPIVLGKLIAERFGWKLHKILTLILGLIIFSLVGFVPFIGWALAFLVVLWAFGAILKIESQILKEWR